MSDTNTRALLEQALEVIVANTVGKDELERAISAELAKPATTAQHDAPEVSDLKAERDELLAALKELLSELEYGHACPLTKEKSRAAIAKAEGKSDD